ncbi:helix-turn-helix domain-containing protein [Hymenobacter cellulosivorans]|uniref:Helix-turn-helix domain-containing protein n=1 Tax=Hymenobacter cellulosivorans TaxID=2932249 RepID=A0ABY4FG27_9BACT|nr:helix-turn-helix domain-containing protein [Hymenobacter cellulosivorans]UOQ55643.1 helix-turn-helix domain-containing protein [Hymenobacter cellulosivorans]
MELLITTLPQLEQLISRLLDKQLLALEKLLRTSSGTTPAFTVAEAEYLSTNQALEFLHLSKPTLNKLRRQGLVHSYAVSNKRVLYARQELVQYLQSRAR